jgi:N-acetylglucosaminyl-diphospho-decaprenol L-rhamnosyltransferase
MPTQETPVQVSVVMVTFKTGAVLWDSIESVLSQPVELELIIVNNGNPDPVFEKLKDLEHAHSNVQLMTGQGNVGFSRACNLGAQRASGQKLIFLNPDCVLFPNCLEAVLHSLEALPNDALVGGNLLDSEQRSCHNTRREFPTPWRLVVESLYLYKLAPNHPYFKRMKDAVDVSAEAPVLTSVVSGAFMIVAREMFDLLDGFDEDYFLHVEDVDYCMRHHLSNHPTYFCPSARAYHFRSSSDASWFRVELYKAQSFLTYFRKHFSSSYPAYFMGILGAVLYGRYFARVILKLFSFGKLPASARFQSSISSQELL